MKFTIQKYDHDTNTPPGIYIELDVATDLPELLKEGYIRLPIMDDGQVAQHVTLYLKGRGINPERID